MINFDVYEFDSDEELDESFDLEKDFDCLTLISANSNNKSFGDLRTTSDCSINLMSPLSSFKIIPNSTRITQNAKKNIKSFLSAEKNSSTISTDINS